MLYSVLNGLASTVFRINKKPIYKYLSQYLLVLVVLNISFKQVQRIRVYQITVILLAYISR